MTWMKVDDGLHSHRKALRAGAEAMGLWVMAGSWVGDQLTDGFVPDYVVRQFVSDPDTVAGRLVAAGLWEPGELDGDKGWWFHDWLVQNPSREKVLAERARNAASHARGRKAQAEKRRKSRSMRDSGSPGGTHRGTRTGTGGGTPGGPDPGSLPSSGTPAADAGDGAPAAVTAEHVPSSSAETRARAREIAGLRPPPRRRGRRPSVQDRPLMTTVRDPRAEQDRLAELDAVQAVEPPPGGLPPSTAGAEPAVYQQKREAG